MSMDPITEVVAHFIGALKLDIEQARLRFAYDEFDELDKKDEEPEAIGNIDVAADAPYKFTPFDPGLKYLPSFPEIPPEPLPAQSIFKPILGYSTSQNIQGQTFGDPAGFFPSPVPQFELTLIPPDPPGSVAVVGLQQNFLTDNDIINQSELGNDYFSPLNMNSALQKLSDVVQEHAPLPSLDKPQDEEAIGTLIEKIEKIAADLQALGTEDTEGHALAGQDAAGWHVNGQTVEELPVLNDYLPADGSESDTEAKSSNSEESEMPQQVSGQGALTYSTSLVVEAGGNMLVNDAGIVNVWTLSPVVVVGGDSHSVDFISQVSIAQSVDVVVGMPTIDGSPLSPTEVFNIASLTGGMSNAEENSEGANVDAGFPSNWTVTRLDTNLVILNWIEQMNFVSDSDALMVSSSGTEATITGGGNLAVNGFSLTELGYNFDLIVIGGNYYSANIINQTNILLDDDYITVAGDGELSSNGTVSTDDNLLWSQANIQTTGSINFEAMPEHFLQLHEGLSEGSDNVNADVLGEDSFAGLQVLRVLYIEGDYYDLQYIDQTNILGDNDQIALLTEGLEDAASSEWSVESGGNALINNATIIDVIPDTTVYVGGEQYSDELLYQADLMPNTDGIGGEETAALLNEAVVFLADDMLQPGTDQQHEAPPPGLDQDTTSGDLMQTMLS